MTGGPTRVPDLDAILGEDVTPGERDRLEWVHALLVEAGAPPELSPQLRTAAGEDEPVTPLFPRHRMAFAIVAVAAVAFTVFGAGFLAGSSERAAEPERTIEMAAPATDAGRARASLAVFAADDAGNWPMELTVTGLPPLPAGQTYELWLTKGDELAEPCGTFDVEGVGTTSVSLNAPYRLRDFDGWVVVRTGTTEPLLTT